MKTAYQTCTSKLSALNPEEWLNKLQLFYCELSEFIDSIPINKLGWYLTQKSPFVNYLNSLQENAIEAIRGCRIACFKLLQETFYVEILKPNLNAINDINKSAHFPKPSQYVVSICNMLVSQLNAFLKSKDDNTAIYIKDLGILYMISILKSIPLSLTKLSSTGACQLAIDIDSILSEIYEKLLGKDPVYGDKILQLKEVARWKRFFKILFEGAKEGEIGDLQHIKWSNITIQGDKLKMLRENLSMLEV